MTVGRCVRAVLTAAALAGSMPGLLSAQAPAAAPPPAPAVANPTTSPSQATDVPERVTITAGRSTVLFTPFDITRIAVTNPAVADAVVVKSREVLVDGKSAGTVSLIVWGAGERRHFDVVVDKGVTTLEQNFQQLFPGEAITVSVTDDAAILSGAVSSNDVMLRAGELAKAAMPKLNVINMLQLPSGSPSKQVMLQVRFAEVNRNALQQSGLALVANRQNIAGRTTTQQFPAPDFDNDVLEFTDFLNIFLFQRNQGIGGVLKALQGRGFLQSLAEPNLIAMHGQKASFLAGGEFPIPIVQSVASGQNSITVIFKEFGIKLNFTPTILDENHIRLELEPEVSSLDFSSGIQIEGLLIPGLRVRRAKTVLELRDGQSFALAGLIDNSEQVNLSKVPLLGDVPILGELFKSRSFQRNETELMFLVTVKLVEPLNPDQLPKLPGVTELKPMLPANPTTSVEGQAGHAIAPRANAVATKSHEQPLAATQASVPVNVASPAAPTGATGAQAKPPANNDTAPPKKP